MVNVKQNQGFYEVDPIDMHIGARLKQKRMSLNLSHARLAIMSRIPHEKIAKYEYGLACIDANNLYKLAGCLKTPISYFYEEADTVAFIQSSNNSKHVLKEIILDMLPALSFEDLYFLQAYKRIEDANDIQMIYDLVTSFDFDFVDLKTG